MRAAAVQAALSRREEDMPMSSRRYTGIANHAVVSPSLSFGDKNGRTVVSSGRADSRSSTPDAPSQVRGGVVGGCVLAGC